MYNFSGELNQDKEMILLPEFNKVNKIHFDEFNYLKYYREYEPKV